MNPKKLQPRWIGRSALPVLVIALLFAGFLPAGTAHREGRVPEADQGEGVDPTAGIATEQKLFEFRSGFWLNLHHFLHLQAILATPGTRRADAETSVRESPATHNLSPESQAIWDKAVQFYMQYAKRDPLSDRDLMRVNYELSDAGNSASLKGRKLPTGMQEVLEEVAGIYRQQWWPTHDRQNRDWAKAEDRLLQKYGDTMARRLAAAFQTEWPKEKPTVEVVAYANWAGAYTTLHSTLITISSVDPSGLGYAMLETLFHETSHALVENLDQQLAKSLRAVNKAPTFQLTHVMIFYTAGRVTAETLEQDGIHDYIPYAIKYDLYGRIGDWAHYKEICDHHWFDYLEGRTTFGAALTEIAKEF